MSLAAAHLAGPPAPAAPQSKVDVWLGRLDDEERDAALAILRDPSWPHTEVAELFSKNGLDVSAHQLGTYRKRLNRVAG